MRVAAFEGAEEEEEEEEDKQAGGRKINAMCCDNEPGSMPTGAPHWCPGSLSLGKFGRAWPCMHNVHF